MAPASLRHVLMTLAVFTAVGLSACEKAPPRFPHLAHLTEQEVTCMTCHPGIPESTRSITLTEPTYSTCAQCHKADTGPSTRHRYETKNTGVGDPERKHVIFSHKDHFLRTGKKCVGCHEGVGQKEPGLAMLPAMATCLGACHGKDYEAYNCNLCHKQADLTGLRPVTDVPHGMDYVARHGRDAVRAKRLCVSCHTENQCLDCHDTSTGIRSDLTKLDDVLRRYSHRGDPIGRHVTDFRMNPSSCAKCHTPSSCDSCHVRSGVSGNAKSAIRQHPAGYGTDKASPEFHGRQARRRINECAACHDQGPATNCIECHRVGAGNGNPHPSGWRSSQGKSGFVCQYCHAR